MSPSRSKTIVLPSGLTSTFIHVPSDVSNDSVDDSVSGAVMSHLLLLFLLFLGETGLSHNRQERQEHQRRTTEHGGLTEAAWSG